MKTIRRTKRIFLFSLIGMLLTTNISIGTNLILEEYKITTDMLGSGGLWIETGILRIVILGLFTLVYGLKLLDIKYMNKMK